MQSPQHCLLVKVGCVGDIQRQETQDTLGPFGLFLDVNLLIYHFRMLTDKQQVCSIACSHYRPK